MIALYLLVWALGAVPTGAALMYKFHEHLYYEGHAYGQRGHGDVAWNKFLMTAGGIVWPLVWVCALAAGAWAIVYFSMRKTTVVLGTRHNLATIRASTIKMREDDLQRVGGSLELALRYSYHTCERCFGSGRRGASSRCDDCSGKGVQRVHTP